MTVPHPRTRFLASALAVLAVWLLVAAPAVTDARTVKEGAMSASSSAVSLPDLPPIDVSAPARIATASFGLG